MASASRNKGSRIERELVERHKLSGTHAVRVDAKRGQFGRDASHDIDIYLFGKNEPQFVCEVKARKNGEGFATLEKWLGENDALFLRKDRSDPMVVLPWSSWMQILDKLKGA